MKNAHPREWIGDATDERAPHYTQSWMVNRQPRCSHDAKQSVNDPQNSQRFMISRAHFCPLVGADRVASHDVGQGRLSSHENPYPKGSISAEELAHLPEFVVTAPQEFVLRKRSKLAERAAQNRLKQCGGSDVVAMRARFRLRNNFVDQL
jgi:hypothetical protein